MRSLKGIKVRTYLFVVISNEALLKGFILKHAQVNESQDQRAGIIAFPVSLKSETKAMIDNVIK